MHKVLPKTRRWTLSLTTAFAVMRAGVCGRRSRCFGAPSLRPLWPKVSTVLRACPKRTGKACFECQQGRSKTDFLSQTVQNRLELASARQIGGDNPGLDFHRPSQDRITYDHQHIRHRIQFEELRAKLDLLWVPNDRRQKKQKLRKTNPAAGRPNAPVGFLRQYGTT